MTREEPGALPAYVETHADVAAFLAAAEGCAPRVAADDAARLSTALADARLLAAHASRTSGDDGVLPPSLATGYRAAVSGALDALGYAEPGGALSAYYRGETVSREMDPRGLFGWYFGFFRFPTPAEASVALARAGLGAPGSGIDPDAAAAALATGLAGTALAAILRVRERVRSGAIERRRGVCDERRGTRGWRRGKRNDDRARTHATQARVIRFESTGESTGGSPQVRFVSISSRRAKPALRGKLFVPVPVQVPYWYSRAERVHPMIWQLPMLANRIVSSAGQPHHPGSARSLPPSSPTTHAGTLPRRWRLPSRCTPRSPRAPRRSPAAPTRGATPSARPRPATPIATRTTPPPRPPPRPRPPAAARCRRRRRAVPPRRARRRLRPLRGPRRVRRRLPGRHVQGVFRFRRRRAMPAGRVVVGVFGDANPIAAAR